LLALFTCLLRKLLTKFKVIDVKSQKHTTVLRNFRLVGNENGEREI